MRTIDLNNNFQINLDVLIDTKLLIQANSGGGKSWCIRRLLEQSHGKVQQIVIDLEGEFSSLREKYDYILAGKDGDTPADPRSATLLAKRLLELNVSAIIDLYELDQYNRRRFVKLFLDALVDAPKRLWHPCIVVVDEAHFFCPEKGQSEAMNSVIDLATRGRKRGFCAVLATQRLSKLHKDAAAECNNKLIGRTGLDIDMKRASEELGFTSKEQYLSLRSLEPGEFFAFGPAISIEVNRVKIGDVQTTHPKAGSRILTEAPKPPTNAIKKLLPKLSDLPQEAEEEAKTIDELKKQITNLKRDLTIKSKSPDILVSEQEIDRRVNQELSVHQTAMNSVENAYKIKLDQWKKFGSKVLNIFVDIHETAKGISLPDDSIGASYTSKIKSNYKIVKPNPLIEQSKYVGISMINPQNNSSTDKLPLASRKIYTFLYSNSDREFSKVQVSAVTGYSHKSGGFNNALAQLNSLGLIQRNGNMIKVGIMQSDLIDNSHAEEYSAELWLHKLGQAPRRIYEYLWNNPQEEVSKETLANIVGYSYTSGGYNNALARLNSLGLIRRLGSGLIKLNEELLEI